MAGLIVGIVVIILAIVQLVTFIMVLIRLFKNEGIFKGILGILCSIYTFVWGWIKHRELQLTKIMLVWSCALVLSMVLQGLVAALGVGSVMEMMEAAKEPPPSPVVQAPVRKAQPPAAPTATSHAVIPTVAHRMSQTPNRAETGAHLLDRWRSCPGTPRRWTPMP